MESGPSSQASETEQEYWNARYRSGNTSGYGSYGEQLAKKLEWLKPLEFTTVLEIGCGDFNFGKNLMFQQKLPLQNYYGVDISDVVIERNRKFYPSCTFEVLRGGLELPKSDLTLCVDVLYHIYDDRSAEDTLNMLESLWTKYLAISAYEYDQEANAHVRIRKFDPARFGTPILREIIEEDGQLYFYIFER